MGNSWWDSADCEKYRYRMLTGALDGPTERMHHWYRYLEERYPQVRPGAGGSWLSLCCGRGSLERHFAAREAFQSCLALDVSEEALGEARSLAQGEGLTSIEYRQADLNCASLDCEAYDVVIVQGGMHHIHGLDHAFEQIAGGLRQDGVLLMHEYVGPNRLRFSPREEEVINATLHLVPERFRTSGRPPGTVDASESSPSGEGLTTSRSIGFSRLRARVARRLHERDYAGICDALTVRARHYEGVLRYGRGRYARLFEPETYWRGLSQDPSESVSSEQVLPAMRRHLQEVEVKALGGTLLWWLQPFDWERHAGDPDFDRAVSMLISIEESLIAIGDLSPHVVHVAARRPSQAGDLKRVAGDEDC